ncbi:MAG TPA: hypothetical protein VL043_11775 [Protaetiibacter sp.]|nr:hypothetical protein [Protaetiibacter sp.]
MPSHEHFTRDIKPLGKCRACDDYHERNGLTVEQIELAMLDAEPEATLRLLRILRDVNPKRHAEVVDWIGWGRLLAEAVDEAMGEWPLDAAGSAPQRPEGADS